jgi:CDP-6-deoxy-D-xylo-4-hexulose-3-dehydrase
MRDWGRDCWCEAGRDNSCGKRFEGKHGDLPDGYDHKYTYSHLGYNLKMTEMQAAVGVAQMEKLSDFTLRRRWNANFLSMRLGFHGLNPYYRTPRASTYGAPSWFGYAIAVEEDKLSRVDALKALEANGISTRMFFAGDVTRQPYFLNGCYDYRIYGHLTNTDYIVQNGFWIGIHQQIAQPQLEHVVQVLAEIVRKYGRKPG